MDVQSGRVGRGNRGRKGNAGAIQGEGPPAKATGNGKRVAHTKQPVHKAISEDDYLDIIP